MKRLDLVVGPNGAGKTTFVTRALLPALPYDTFVNADLIAARLWPYEAAVHAYEAARIAARSRDELISRGESFVTETVFSHPSKLELIRDARNAGYAVALHVLMIPEDLAIARVSYRVRAGGHSVPDQKIRERYRRLWTHVARANTEVQAATVYDNSHGAGPEQIAAFRSGVEIARSAWPVWTPEGLRTADFLRHHFTEESER